MSTASAKSMGARFRQAMKERGLTQAQFADAFRSAELSVTQGAVSQWFSGATQPDPAKLSAAATILKVPQPWLETGTGQNPFLDRLRQEYRQQVKWAFRSAPADGGRDYGNANTMSFEPSLDVFMREVLQNFSDAILPDYDGDPSIEFRLTRLTDTARAKFLQAIGWNAAAVPSLRDHLQASAGKQQKVARVIKDNLAFLDSGAELILLTIIDCGTRGLTGPEKESGNFVALCRNNLDTHKNSSAAGGSYGLGKAVLWLASRCSTVFFHSNLSEPVLIDGEPLSMGRLIGKTDLPWHECGGNACAGPGWFGQGEDSGAWTSSLWDNEALAEDLYLERPAETGTTIGIVGFHDPSGVVPTDLQSLSTALAGAAARHFWPAITRQLFSIKITQYDGSALIGSVPVDVDQAMHPFAEALRAKDNGTLKDKLEQPGDVAVRDVIFEFPKTKSQPRPSEKITQTAKLLVRLDSAQDRNGPLAGHAACLRGSHMIVMNKSLKAQMIGGSGSFHAVLLCGRAAADSDADITAEDEQAEEFLRAAEPPAHNTWTSTTDLGSSYARGGPTDIRNFFTRVTDAAHELVRSAPPAANDGPDSLKELLRLTSGSDGTIRATSKPRLGRVIYSTVDPLGRWNITAEIKLPNDRQWRVTPTLVFRAETGPGVTVDWTLEAQDGCTTDGDSLLLKSASRKARFRGISDATSHPIPARDSSVLVELRSVSQTDSQ